MTINKRQFVSSLEDVLSSAERPSSLSVTDDRGEPVSSNLTHACTAAVDIDDAGPKIKHTACVRHANIHAGLRDVASISAPSFPAYLSKEESAQQLVCSTMSALSKIVMSCDDCCTKVWLSCILDTNLTTPTQTSIHTRNCP